MKSSILIKFVSKIHPPSWRKIKKLGKIFHFINNLISSRQTSKHVFFQLTVSQLSLMIKHVWHVFALVLTSANILFPKFWRNGWCDIWSYLRDFPQKIIKICTPDLLFKTRYACMPPINDPYAAFQIKGYCIFRIGAHKGEKFLEKFLSSVEERNCLQKYLCP